MFDRVQQEVEILKRHFTVLRLVHKREPIGLVQLMNRSQYPRLKIQYSLKFLTRNGLVSETSRGYVTGEEVELVLNNQQARLQVLKRKLHEISGLKQTLRETDRSQTSSPEATSD